MSQSSGEEVPPESDRYQSDQYVIVGTSVTSDDSQSHDQVYIRRGKKKNNSISIMLIGTVILLTVIVIILVVTLFVVKNSNIPEKKNPRQTSQSLKPQSQDQIKSGQLVQQNKPSSGTKTTPANPIIPVQNQQPRKPSPPTLPPPPPPPPPSNQKKSNEAQTFMKAVLNFNPWDLSVEKKKQLLKKYKNMPKKDPNTFPYMPILQNYDEQIKPILEEFQKNMEVIKYQQTPMSQEQRNKYTVVFEEKLRNRLSQKRRQRDQQRGNSNNPNGIFNAQSRISRGQWFNAFQYHTLVGVNLNKDQEAKLIAEKQIKYYEDKYKVSQYPKEIGMCIVTPSYNNVDHDRYLWTLESVFQQNYTNFRMVILDDASPDKTYEKVAQHLRWRNASQSQYIVVKSTKNHKPMGNIFYGSQKYCNFSEIQYVIDGDDELIGRQVFKVMNAMYQKQKMLTIYSSHIVAAGTMDRPMHYLGISKDYWQHDIENNNFRKTRRRGYHHLRTMMSDTILLMRPSSFKDWRNLFYWAVGDNACYYPAMQMSCKKVLYLNQIFYIYNYNTGQTEDAASQKKRQDYNQVLQHINNQKPYRCLAMQFLQLSQA